MNIEDLNISLTDSSVKEYTDELLKELIKLRFNFDTHAMSEYKLFKEGQRDMLDQIIAYIQKTV